MIRLTSVYIYSFLTSITVWLFLHVQKSYGEGIATFEEEALLNSLHYFKEYYIAFGLFFLSILFYKRIAYIIFSILSMLVVYYSIKLQLIHFNKISILIMFMFMIISYYHVYFLYRETKEPYYFVNNSIDNLVRTNLVYQINCNIESLSKNLKSQGNIVSWSEAGIFIYNKEGLGALSDHVVITVEKYSRFFHFNGTIISMTKDYRGVGIKLDLEKDKNTFGWEDLYQILQDRGIGPSYVM